MAEHPGSAIRQDLQTWADGVLEVMAQTGRWATGQGVTDFQCGHEVLDRTVLAPFQPPRKTDRVMWFFTGKRWIRMRGRKPIPVDVRGEYVVEPGAEPHAVGCAYAAKSFLEQLGVVVTLKDMGVE